MNKLVILFYFLSIFLFTQCGDKSDPSPTPTSSQPANTTPTIIAKEYYNNSFSFGNTSKITYYTTIAAEESLTSNGKNLYVLVITDDATSSIVEFWFNSKPAAGSYSVQSLTSSVYGVPNGQVGIYCKASDVVYFSKGIGTITVSYSGSNIIVTVDQITLADSNNSSNTGLLTCTATIP